MLCHILYSYESIYTKLSKLCLAESVLMVNTARRYTAVFNKPTVYNTSHHEYRYTGWHCGLAVIIPDSQFRLPAMTLPGYFWDRWPSLAGNLPGMWPSSNQPCIPQGLPNRVPASAKEKTSKSVLWFVIFRVWQFPKVWESHKMGEVDN